MVIKNVVLALVIAVLFICCEKSEAEGGTSSISGKVLVQDFNSNFSVMLTEYYAQEQRVYIIYGNDITHSDDVRTNYDGTYRFSYLRKGTYKVFAYSKDSSGVSQSGMVPVIKTVEITENNQHIELEDMIVFD